MRRVLASCLLLLLATGCAIVPLDQYYGRGGYSHGHDRYDRDRDDRDHRDDRNRDDDYWRRTH